MSALAEDPRLTAFCRHWCEHPGDAAALCGLVDWLAEDTDFTPADLLAAYAGRPDADPLRSHLGLTWEQDEALRLALARWLEAAEPGKLGPASFGPEGRTVTLLPRFEAVRRCGLDWQAAAEGAGIRIGRLPDEPGLHDRLARNLVEGSANATPRDDPSAEERRRRCGMAIARARRRQKRAVLALFPEVRGLFRAAIDARHYRYSTRTGDDLVRDRLDDRVGALLKEAGIRPELYFETRFDAANRRHLITQDIAAPDWIAPERTWVLPDPGPVQIAGGEDQLGELLRRLPRDNPPA